MGYEMTEKKIRVVYILGLGRSGTTLITSLLNSHKDIVGVGELNNILRQHDNTRCSCGQVLDQCPFWLNVMNDVKKRATASREEIRNCINRQELKKNFFNPFKRIEKKYLEINKELYSAISRRSEKNIIIDSSKNIMRYFSIKSLFDTTTITVIRNPFGVCWSLMKIYGSKQARNRIMIYSLLSYTFNNLLIITLSKFNKSAIVFKYEDIPNVANAESFWEKLGLTKKFDLNKEYHIGFGNDLIHSFDPLHYVFKEDVAYKEKLNVKWKLLTALLTWPIMIIEGYRC